MSKIMSTTPVMKNNIASFSLCLDADLIGIKWRPVFGYPIQHPPFQTTISPITARHSDLVTHFRREELLRRSMPGTAPPMEHPGHWAMTTCTRVGPIWRQLFLRRG